MYLNARSLKTVNSRCNKLVELQNLADDTDSDVIAITESWLNDTVSDSEILNSNYTLYRRDRADKRGGGIVLAVKKTLDSCLVNSLMNHEVMAINVKGQNGSILFQCFMLPSTRF